MNTSHSGEIQDIPDKGETDVNRELNGWLFLFLPIGLLLFAAYFHNLKPAFFYWWYELTTPWTWFSLRYWFLGSLYDAMLLATSFLPVATSFWAAGSLKARMKESVVKRIGVALGFIFLMISSSLAAGLIAGYIGPNYLAEFYHWYYR